MDDSKKILVPFSREWWSNFWYYYKWYVIGAAGLIVCLVIFLVECVFTVRADFTMTYLGRIEKMGQIEAYTLEDKLAPHTEDINQDEKSVVKVNIIYLDRTQQSEEMGAMFKLADIEMMGGDTVVYLFDEQYLSRYERYGFYDLTEWAEKYNIDESLLKRYDDGRVYAISMAQNPILNSVEGINTEGLYLAVRPLRDNDKTDWHKKNHQNGLVMAEYIISGGNKSP